MDFGYNFQPSSAVNLDKTDLSVYNRLLQTDPDAATCIGCGSCSATCTGSQWSGMSVRKVLLLLQRGKRNEARNMLSGCMLCGKCTMVCPRGINTRHIILTLCRIMDDKEEKL